MADEERIERILRIQEAQIGQTNALIEEIRADRETTRDFLQALSAKLDDRFADLDAKITMLAQWQGLSGGNPGGELDSGETPAQQAARRYWENPPKRDWLDNLFADPTTIPPKPPEKRGWLDNLFNDDEHDPWRTC